MYCVWEFAMMCLFSFLSSPRAFTYVMKWSYASFVNKDSKGNDVLFSKNKHKHDEDEDDIILKKICEWCRSELSWLGRGGDGREDVDIF
jgi:hypothetical protein